MKMGAKIPRYKLENLQLYSTLRKEYFVREKEYVPFLLDNLS